MIDLYKNGGKYFSWIFLGICSAANMYLIFCLLQIQGLTGSAAAQSEIGYAFLVLIIGIPTGIFAGIGFIASLIDSLSNKKPSESIFTLNTIGYFINLSVPILSWFLR